MTVAYQPDEPNTQDRVDAAQAAHLVLVRARLTRLRAERAEELAQAAYGDAMHELMEPATPSHVTTYTGLDLAQMRRPWRARAGDGA